MKLRKLSLQGYKTFASKTEFLFDSGITAIVGPNGSGKSNIADALRWVLGEQSFGTLRARRSADMIFAGSQQRARAGMAQATITLDNSDGWLPIDYTEVEIARRSFRSGENEYLINGQQVRLKDVADLLATSGLAERTYTIIGQGLVDQALSLRSDERRALFEEAAGITHYKTRRAETLRRLEETQRNLQRVHDILEELRPRVTSLKRQATRTRNYEQISADLRELLRVWYGYKWEQAKSDLRAARSNAASAEHAWTAAREKLLAHQGHFDEAQGRLAQAQLRAGEIQTRRDKLRQEVEAARRSQAIYRERRASFERQIAEADSELSPLETLAASARLELEAATADLQAAQIELQAHQTGLQEFRIAFEGRRAEIARAQAEVARVESERRQTQTTLAQAEGQLTQLRVRLEELTAETDPANAGSDITESVATLESTSTAARNETVRLQAARNDESRARNADIGRLKELRRALRDAEQRLNKERNDLARQEERVAQLERQGQRAIRLEPEAVVGRLAALIRIPKAHEPAIVAALGERLAAWLVTDGDSLWRAVANARSSSDDSESRLTLAALDAQTQPASRPDTAGESGVIGWADERVDADDAVAPLVRRLLGNILLVKDAPSAYRLAAGWPSGYTAAAPDGVLVHGGGLVEVGAAAGDGILARETRRRDETTRLVDMRAALAKHEAGLVKQQEEIDALQEQVDERANEERRLLRLENEAGQTLNETRRQLENLRQQRDFVARRQNERATARAQAETRIAQAEMTITSQNERLARSEAALTEARDRLAALPTGEAEQQQQSLRQSLAAAQTILAGRQAVVDSRRATLNQSEGQLNRLRGRLAGLREQLAGLGREEDEAETAVLERELAELEVALTPLLSGMEADRALLGRLQADSAGLQRHAHDLETQLTQVRIRQTQHENQIEGLQERIRADLGLVSLSYDAEQTGPHPLPIREVVEELPAVDELPPDIEENIHHYRGQLQRMGPINPDAPAELATTEERFEFLTQQVGDLTETDAQLRGVIAELDELTSKAFSKTVEEVNGIFDQTFQQLFGGGSGRLVMTDPDDPTSSGVEIIARLPNRREQGLALLSGGERSLTAAALIFSLLKVAPPPFCVLDEVDAALDEANVNRFRDVLRELGQHTQFILITHNRGTVQAAQTLYGVSMQPDSSSQVISIKPEEYLRRG
ncbi:MAG TPA: chromosome segregation protein SMC [Promineifilum sp.]|nr:chromosome segregation protein SMC [Promineifilum sp.]HRQ12821.1 chromosome segregation protein SMC [Promineifilum sp.]